MSDLRYDYGAPLSGKFWRKYIEKHKPIVNDYCSEESKVMRTLSRAVIIRALQDCVMISDGFIYRGVPYVDENDVINFKKIKCNNIHEGILQWFESTETGRGTYLYWVGFSGLNPACIKKYIQRLRAIINEVPIRELEDLRFQKAIRQRKMHSKKWMNV